MRLLGLTGVLLVGLALACARGAEVAVRDEGRLGSVTVFATGGSHAGVVFLISDSDGWSPDLTAVASRVAAAGAVVVGVDLRNWLRGLRASDDGCHYVVAEIEDLSHRLEREHGFPRYRAPILAGLGAGGTLAYAALAQAPAATVDGAISVDPTPTLGTRVPLCEGAPATTDPAGGYRYGPRPGLPGWWEVSPATALPAPLAAIAESATDPTPPAGPAVRLRALILVALARADPFETTLADLPLVEVPSAHASTQMAVIYSGDGGWRDLDRSIAGVLAREGTPVVGVDSLRYFWNEKTPDGVATDLARILHHYRRLWGAARVILVGYSFGADVLPFAIRGLPPDLRDAVVQVSLLGLGHRAAFRVSVRGWLGATDEGLPVLPALQSFDLSRVQCVYGDAEEDSLCPATELAGAERIRTSGGHHFDGDYERLAREILTGAARRSSRTPGPRRADTDPRPGGAECPWRSGRGAACAASAGSAPPGRL